jgi:hypothetical protein
LREKRVPRTTGGHYANAGRRLYDLWRTLSASRRGLHKGGERVKDSILQLMKTVVQVPTKDRKGNPATEFVQILSDTTSY